MKKNTTTYQIHREHLLHQLRAVWPGITTNRETLEQSSCFVFQAGKVTTFNNQTGCSCPCDLDIQCAVVAQNLLETLERFDSEHLRIKLDRDIMTFTGNGKDASIRIEREIRLPFGDIEVPKRWTSLPEDFDEAVQITTKCSSHYCTDPSLQCVHMHPQWFEATDDYQFARYTTTTGLATSRQVWASSLKHTMGRNMAQVSVTRNWLHFRNAEGLVISCRSLRGKYPDLDRLLDCEGVTVSLPKSLVKSVRRGRGFGKKYDDIARLQLLTNKLVINMEGSSGVHEEEVAVKYEGVPRTFLLHPKQLFKLARMIDCCQSPHGLVSLGALKNGFVAASLDMGNFIYVVAMDSEQQEFGKKTA
ncbi:hypothetical protein [Gimesia chilikensis]|uniref:hypothetical protein n=1 Tax=Gimesia chilikensis TaxID=2605989 RepID=UPI00118CC804|nr:hypothetical protein [Gimesia chilikensis]QDT82461.1 hypothetical protein MalM14_00880 [Gimesia chilikensis]